MAMSTKPREARAASDAQKVFAYSVGPDRIRAFATMKIADDAPLTVLSSRPLPGLKTRELKGLALPGGLKGVTVAVAGGGAVGVDAVVSESAFAPNARARAILRGMEFAWADLRDAGGAYDLAQVRGLLSGVSRQAIDKRVKDGSLLAVPGPNSRRAYPTFQFNSDGSVVAGLRDVRQALPTRNPWAVLNFLVNPQDGLGGAKTIDRLRAGAVDEVVAAARRVGEQGA